MSKNYDKIIMITAINNNAKYGKTGNFNLKSRK